ncbi:MAG TPA: TIM barrel protein [Tepidisphaeraceae bacterium]|jgi:hydroxypyruvate isomerase|nr:TIM barrel protein [Tepidisphaeraceae bacterium]
MERAGNPTAEKGLAQLSRREAFTLAAGATAAMIASQGAGRMALAAEAPAEVAADGPAIRNNRITQTLCQWCYTKLSLEELCAAGAKLGYKGIDLVGPSTFPTLKKYNLTGTMTPSHGITKGLNHKDNWDMCLGLIRKSIEATAEAGFPNVICFSGNREKMDEHEGLLNCRDALKQVVGLAEEKKVTICMELLNSKVNHPDYMCDHSPWGIELVKAVGSERFKLLYDIYHMQIMEGDVIATITKYHEYFAHYHTAGVPGRHEIDDTQELYYPAVMKAILATGYKGWVGQEFLPVHDTVASLAQAGRICDV